MQRVILPLLPSHPYEGLDGDAMVAKSAQFHILFAYIILHVLTMERESMNTASRTSSCVEFTMPPVKPYLFF